MSQDNSHGTPKISIPSEGILERYDRNADLDRVQGMIESATSTTFGIMRTHKDSSPPPTDKMLETVDRVIALGELLLMLLEAKERDV
jgi:hypothetical protein